MEIEGLIKVVAQKDLNGLKVRLPNDLCRKLGINERDVLSFAYDKEKSTLRKTGETSVKMRSFPPQYFEKKNKPNSEPKPVREQKRTPLEISQIKTPATPPEPSRLTSIVPPIQKTTFTFTEEEATVWVQEYEKAVPTKRSEREKEGLQKYGSGKLLRLKSQALQNASQGSTQTIRATS